jgi:hypothetical protein
MILNKQTQIGAVGYKSLIAFINDKFKEIKLKEIDIYLSAMAEIQIFAVMKDDVGETKENDIYCQSNTVGFVEENPLVVGYPVLKTKLSPIYRAFGIGKIEIEQEIIAPIGTGILVRVKTHYSRTEVAVNLNLEIGELEEIEMDEVEEENESIEENLEDNEINITE